MAMSGVSLDASVVDLFNEIKLRHTHAVALFKISDDQKSIVLDEAWDPIKEATSKPEFNTLKEKLTTAEPRYIIFDFRFEGSNGTTKEKLGYIYWCSDDCPIKKRMVYAASKETMTNSLEGFGAKFEAHDASDLDWAAMCKELEKRGQ